MLALQSIPSLRLKTIDVDVNLILAPSEGGVDCEADIVARQDLTKLIEDKSASLPRCFKQMRCRRAFESWTLDA